MTGKTESTALLKDLVLRLAEDGKWDEAARALTGQHPADIAEVVRDAPSETREHIFSVVDEEIKPDVLSHLEGTAEEEVLESLTNAELSDLVEDMAPDDAADVIADLSEERSHEVLELMEREESDEVRELLKYAEESAGGIMTPDLLAFRDTDTVAEALDKIAMTDQDEPVYNAYVVDRDGRLVGVIGLWELLKVRDRSARLASVAHTDIVSVPTDMDQEHVAQTMSKYDLTSLPVVDAQHRLVGRVTVDDVMDVIEDEASEDIFRLAGSDDAELAYTSPFQAGRVRLPWLLITMGETFVSSLILRHFMVEMVNVLAIFFFVPIVMATCGSAGMQSATLVIRSLALKTLDREGTIRVLGREIMTGLLMGIVCGVIMALWANFVITHSPGQHASYPPAFLAFTVALALMAAMTFAAAYGALVPILLGKLRVDPAAASGPFVTASNDITALLIYYGTTVSLIAFYHYVGTASL